MERIKVSIEIEGTENNLRTRVVDPQTMKIIFEAFGTKNQVVGQAIGFITTFMDFKNFKITIEEGSK